MIQYTWVKDANTFLGLLRLLLGEPQMWIKMTSDFRREAKEFRFAFRCEDCAHFCGQRENCAIQYPTAPHRAAEIERLQNEDRLYFCKMFEPV